MSRTAEATRARLLDAAADLFYSEGIGVGVEALCRAAGVSKRSMYQLFTSKEDLLAASLARSVPGYLASLLPGPELHLTPARRVLHVFEQLEKVIADPGFRGCPYVSAATEIKSAEHPARVVARRFHDQLTEYFRAAVADGGAAEPDFLAMQLTLVHDGAAARAVVQGAPTPGLALVTAEGLLSSAGLDAGSS